MNTYTTEITAVFDSTEDAALFAFMVETLVQEAAEVAAARAVFVESVLLAGIAL